jgi:hypothetical protein
MECVAWSAAALPARSFVALSLNAALFGIAGSM